MYSSTPFHADYHREQPGPAMAFGWIFLTVLLGGCYAPLHSPGIPASCLPESYRVPTRSIGEPLNFASLTAAPQGDYLLGPDDVLEVVLHGLNPAGEIRPLRAQVMANGFIHLPLVGAVQVGGMNLMDAQIAITKAYQDGYIKEPRVNLYVLEESTTAVLVLGEVNQPGVYELPKYQADVAHALAMAGGIGDDAGTVIEVHRRVSGSDAQAMAIRDQLSKTESDLIYKFEPPMLEEEVPAVEVGAPHILKIPLRGLLPGSLSSTEIRLGPGDVLVVPNRTHEVFYVVGELDQTNVVRFSSGLEVRDLGVGFLLPRDRDLDVVTAVVMAGYIDPIESPTTVTLQRTGPDGQPMLVHVDLIKARYDRRENLMVRAGDIIYLNPDGWWWFRRTLDRIIPELLLLPYERSVLKWFGQDRN